MAVADKVWCYASVALAAANAFPDDKSILETK
jgi:hypothetical protein